MHSAQSDCADGFERKTDAVSGLSQGSARRGISEVARIAFLFNTTTMSLFSSLANKAQSAINQSGLADKLPSSVANALGQQQQPAAGQQPQQGAQGQQYAPAPGQPQSQYQPQHQPTVDSVASAAPNTSGRHHAFENLQHSFRSLQVQYSCVGSHDEIYAS